MSRFQKIVKIAKKKYGGRQVTTQEAKDLLEPYLPGMQQQQRGEVIAATIERFLGQLSEENRLSLESNIRSLHGYSNFKRFRAQTFILLMTEYHNGWARTGEPFNLLDIIKEVQSQIAKKYSILDE
jgi:hypothetical protein